MPVRFSESRPHSYPRVEDSKDQVKVDNREVSDDEDSKNKEEDNKDGDEDTGEQIEREHGRSGVGSIWNALLLDFRTHRLVSF